MTSRVVFTDPDTGLVIDSFEFESPTGAEETLTAHELCVRVLGLAGDPAALLERVEADPVFRRKLLAAEYEPIFGGMHGGKLDDIAGDMISRA